MSKRGRGILRGPGLCAILGIGRIVVAIVVIVVVVFVYLILRLF
jgi:hypothetical protein